MEKLGGAGLYRYGFQFALAYLLLLVLSEFLLGGGTSQLANIARMIVGGTRMLLICAIIWVSQNFIQDNGRVPNRGKIWKLTIAALLISGILRRFYFAIITEWKIQSMTGGARRLIERMILEVRRDQFWTHFSLDIIGSAISIVVIYLSYRIISGRMLKT